MSQIHKHTGISSGRERHWDVEDCGTGGPEQGAQREILKQTASICFQTAPCPPPPWEVAREDGIRCPTRLWLGSPSQARPPPGPFWRLQGPHLLSGMSVGGNTAPKRQPCPRPTPGQVIA